MKSSFPNVHRLILKVKQGVLKRPIFSSAKLFCDDTTQELQSGIKDPMCLALYKSYKEEQMFISEPTEKSNKKPQRQGGKDY